VVRSIPQESEGAKKNFRSDFTEVMPMSIEMDTVAYGESGKKNTPEFEDTITPVFSRTKVVLLPHRGS